MPTLHPIIALIGSSGSGKTALIIEMVKRHPTLLAPLKSVTSRPKRDEADSIFYDFYTAEQILEMKANNQLVQHVEHAGNHYGTAKDHVYSILSKKFGMNALVEQSIKNFQEAQISLVLVKVIPLHAPEKIVHRGNDAIRAKEDQERAKIALDYALIIENDFIEGGFEKAADQLEKFIIEKLLPQYPVS